jgi:CHRD domain
MLRTRNLIGAPAAAFAIAANTKLDANLSGAKEVPGPGDANGTGSAEITLKPGAGRVCFELRFSKIGRPLAGHIHKGGKNVAGPIKVPLFGKPSGVSSPFEGCAKNVAQGLINQIADRPGGWYVNLHNSAFPDGAIRGQLKLHD